MIDLASYGVSPTRSEGRRRVESNGLAQFDDCAQKSLDSEARRSIRSISQNRQAPPEAERDEVVTGSQAGLVAIRLDHRSTPRCSDGNCEIERARFVVRDANGVEREGSVVDVHLARR